MGCKAEIRSTRSSKGRTEDAEIECTSLFLPMFVAFRGLRFREHIAHHRSFSPKIADDFSKMADCGSPSKRRVFGNFVVLSSFIIVFKALDTL